MNKIYEGLNKIRSKYSLGMYLDLKKAFDITDTEILLNKLNHYGFKKCSNKWFRNYLTNRTQCACVNGVWSAEQQQTKLKEMTSCKVGAKKLSLKVDLKWSFS